LLKTRDTAPDLGPQNLEETNVADNKINDLLVKVDDLIEETNQWKEDVVSTELENENAMNIKSDFNEFSNKIALLEEENKKLIRNLETANNISNRLVEEIDGYLIEISDLNNEIRDKNVKISALNEKSGSLKRQNSELQERALENLNKEDFTSSQKNIDLIQGNDLETIIENLKEEINKLNNEIVNLKEDKSIVSKKNNQKLRLKQGAPNYYQIDLFMRLFQILDKDEKDILIESIIEDLIKLKDNEIKRYIILLLITILNDLRDDRIYKELLRLFRDDDWLIRLTLVKTLYRTDNDGLIEIFKKPLKSLLDDVDLDVKEASEQILRKISL
jgi:chromosome segregation ATPase